MGGAPKPKKNTKPKAVIKTHLKASADQLTTDSDEQLFIECHQKCKAVHLMTEVNTPLLIKRMNIDELVALKDYLEHNQSNHYIKLETAAESITGCKVLNTVEHKIDVAKQIMKKLFEDYVSDQFSDAKKAITSIVTQLSVEIAVKEEQVASARALAEAAAHANRGLMQRVLG